MKHVQKNIFSPQNLLKIGTEKWLFWDKNGWKFFADLKVLTYPVSLGVNCCLQICNFYACRPKLNNSRNFCIKPTHRITV